MPAGSGFEEHMLLCIHAKCSYPGAWTNVTRAILLNLSKGNFTLCDGPVICEPLGPFCVVFTCECGNQAKHTHFCFGFRFLLSGKQHNEVVWQKRKGKKLWVSKNTIRKPKQLYEAKKKHQEANFSNLCWCLAFHILWCHVFLHNNAKQWGLN